MSDPRPEVVRRVLETERVETHTCLPGRVRSYNAEAQTVEVELGSREVIPSGDDDTADTVRDFPILVDVPVMHPRGGGYYIHIPIENGSTGIVLFAESALGAWFAGQGGPVDPGTGARHSLAGALFLPGLTPQAFSLSGTDRGSGLTLGREGGPRLELRTDQIRVGGSDALAEAADVKAHLNAISTTLASLTGSAAFGTPYVYATVLAGAPIETTITKGT